MISSIGGNSSLQMINALQAFKGTSNVSKPEQRPSIADIDVSSGINLKDNDNLLNKVDLLDVRNFAQKMGEMNLSDEDIKYGLTYGRSVIADYIA